MKFCLKLLLGFALPFFALATDNVTFSGNSIIQISGIDLTIVGSAGLNTIEVNGSSFSVYLDPGQVIEITSSDKRKLSIPTVGSAQIGFQCTSATSKYTVTNPSGAQGATTTVTMLSDTCAVEGGGGGGGGGGGSGVAPTIPVQIGEPVATPQIPTPSVPVPTVATPTAVSASPVFTSGLDRGMRNADVKRLQQLLNSVADTRIAESGPGSSGNETEFFGSLTEQAVQKFQVKYGIAQSGDAGYGYVGPKTRAKLQEVFTGSAPAAIAAPTELPAVMEPAGDMTALNTQVSELQAMINQLLAQINALQSAPATTPAPAVPTPSTGDLPSFINLVPAPSPTGY